MSPMTERFELRLDEATLENVDTWRAQQRDVPSRAEAIRRLIELGLNRTPSEEVSFSDGEKLILTMLRDIYKHLKINKTTSEIDPDFIGDVLLRGHYWALKLEMPGLYHGHKDNPKDLAFAMEVLDLWDSLERGYEKLSKKERQRVEKEAEPFGKNVRFTGFDGNNETTLIGIARFLVEKMDRFERFKGRELNSHMPSVDIYKRMLKVYSPLRSTLTGGDLNVGQIIAILQAMMHPERLK
jgi:uncharacterized protein YfbU (UPF0304 family)